MSSKSSSKNVIVIGAGVVGLSVALKLLESFNESVNVTIIADRFLQQTLTYSCGGLWEPYQIAGTPDEQINKWGKVAFEHFKSLSNGPDAAKSGVQLLTAYQALEVHQDATPPTWRDIVHNFKVLSAEDLAHLGVPSKYVTGFTFGTYVIEQKYYMQYITERLIALGAKFEQRLVENLDELNDRDCDCIINCTGLGAKDLLGDDEMYPVRGQVLRIRAPWMKNVWFFGSSYIIPNVDTVVIGGTAQKGDWNTNVSLQDTENIINNIAQVFPAIRDAPIENAWVGLRPGRTPLRLDRDSIPRGHNSMTSSINSRGRKSGSIHVIHCYGHGGSGVTLAMGCAEDVVENHVQPLLGLLTKSQQQSSNSVDSSKMSTWFNIRSRL